MECGSQDVVCQLTTWLTENELAASWLVELIGRIGESATGATSVLARIAREYGQAIVGLLGLGFGFYRWWLYREQILHKRLEQYIDENDYRLQHASDDLLTAIQRPGPGLRFWDPLFVPAELTSVLRERNWDRAPLLGSVARSAEGQLAQAIDKIERRLEAAAKATTSLQKQLASAHTLRGAIASSVARTPSQNEFALESFRRAQQLPDKKLSVFAAEFAAHQLRKLGRDDYAAKAYHQLIELAQSLDARTQALTISRAKRYLAEIAQKREIMDFLSGQQPGPGSGRACDLMSAKAPKKLAPGALVLREHFAPYRHWEQIENAEMNYFAAFVCELLGFVRLVSQHLRQARADYDALKRDLDAHGWFYRRSRRRLTLQAIEGLQRVERAENGDFDVRWLLPTLEEAEQIAAYVCSSRSQKRVAVAAQGSGTQ